MSLKILFCLKKAVTSGGNYSEQGSSKSGLLNSARFVSNALKHFLKIESKIVVVVDGNGIDKVISENKVYDKQPDIIVLEALWVTPAKLDELMTLYPKKKFIVRIHSKSPFLATEGIATQWLFEINFLASMGYDVSIGFNSKETCDEFKKMGIECAVYLPNFYFPEVSPHPSNKPNQFDADPCFNQLNTVHISCFGATRPMKNQFIQAIAAIEYANKFKKKLCFHINSTRIEQEGAQPLKNIRSLFKNNPQHQLKEWAWLDHDSFLQLTAKMAVSLQVSLSESMNIVTADAVYMGIPVVVSKDMAWLPQYDRVATGSAKVIAQKIREVLRWKRQITRLNKLFLFRYNLQSLFAWKRLINEQTF